MPFQFIHLETGSEEGRDLYSNRNGKKTKTGHISVASILGEAGRLDGYISHIENPESPIILYGDKEKGVEDVREKVNAWAKGTKDARGHKVRKDANALLSGVVSYHPIGDNEDKKEYDTKRNAFEAALIEWLKKVYGEDLVLILRHDDEPFKGINEGKIHYHWHYYCVKKPGQKFDLHPGLKARSEYDISRKDRKNMTADEIKCAYNEGKRAYRTAMIAFQERFYQELGRFHGFARYGQRRLRRTRTEQKGFEEAREHVIEAAQKEAEKTKKDAQNAAQIIEDTARNQAGKILNNAKNEANQISIEAQDILQNAQKQADEIKKNTIDVENRMKDVEREEAEIIKQKDSIEKREKNVLSSENFLKNMTKAITDMRNKLSGEDRIGLSVITELNIANVYGDERKLFFSEFFKRIPTFVKGIIDSIKNVKVQNVQQMNNTHSAEKDKVNVGKPKE